MLLKCYSYSDLSDLMPIVDLDYDNVNYSEFNIDKIESLCQPKLINTSISIYFCFVI